MTLETDTEPVVAERRTVPITIGSRKYTARAPKLKVWLDMATLMEEQQAHEPANRQERRALGGAAPDSAEGIDRVRLNLVLMALLRGSLTKADSAAVDRELDDPESDLDVPDLWVASMELVREFAPDLAARAKAMGLKVPAAIAALGEQAPARRKPQDHRAVKRAPAKRAPAKKAATRR